MHHLLTELDWSLTWKRSAGMLIVAIVSLLIELWAVGYQKSALAKLKDIKDPSVRTDWFHFLVFSLFGLRPVFAALLSMGTVLMLQKWMLLHYSWSLIGDLNVALQFVVLLIINPFLFYLVHRLMHWKFWEIHRVHHSATSMTILTPHRNHPVDWIVVTLVTTIPAALLGANIWVIAAYEFINGVYQSLVHSNMRWNSRIIDRYLLISPEAHRLHHSNDPRHFDKNFGVLTFWDRIFGTYLQPEIDRQKYDIGFTEPKLHNTGNPLKEVFGVFFCWIKSWFKKA